jgi:hypothetical protein
MKLSIENIQTGEVLEQEGTEEELKEFVLLHFPHLIKHPDAPVKVKAGPGEDPWVRESDEFPNRDWNMDFLDEKDNPNEEDVYASDGGFDSGLEEGSNGT